MSLSQRSSATARLIGRTVELQRIQHLLEQHRLITLRGPGGIGKTRLAQELLTQHKGAFVDLTTATTAEQGADLIAQTLGWNHPTRSPQQILLERLPTLTGLLVLDNLEQITGIREPLQSWLAVSPDLRILTTSREALALPDEQILDVLPLGLPAADVHDETELQASEAGRLLHRVARQVNPLLAFTPPEVNAAAQLCRQLDGLPLAIELVASRMDIFTPHAALRLLQDGHMPPGAGTARPARHASVEAAVRWSVELLSPEQQRVFRSLTVFSGNFDTAAVSAVADTSEDHARDMLGVLVDRSLVRALPGERFALLETVRVVGLRQLNAAGEARGVRLRHARHYAERTHELARQGVSKPGVGAQFMRELPQVRGAMEWLTASPGPDAELDDLCCTVAYALPIVLQFAERHNESRMWLERTLSRVGLPDGKRSQLLMMLSSLLYNTVQFEAALQVLRQLQNADAEWPSHILSQARLYKHMCLQHLGQCESSLTEIDDDVTYARHHGHVHDAAMLLLNRASSLIHLGDRPGALRSALEVDALINDRRDELETSNPAMYENILLSLGHAYERVRRYDRALKLFIESAERGERFGHASLLAFRAMQVAIVHREMDDQAEAARWMERVWSALEDNDIEPGRSRARAHALHAAILLQCGQFDECADHLTRGLRQPLGPVDEDIRMLLELLRARLDGQRSGAVPAYLALIRSRLVERLLDFPSGNRDDLFPDLLLLAAQAASPGPLALQVLGSLQAQLNAPEIPLSPRMEREVQAILQPLRGRYPERELQEHLHAGARQDPYELALQIARELQG